MSGTTITQERTDALTRLREMFPVGSTAYTVLRGVSRSGMTRKIDVYAMTDGEPGAVTYLVSQVTSFRRDRQSGALVVPGCGMDLGFHVVYAMSLNLYPDGFECIGERCPANDHSNGDRDYSPHWHGRGAGGYAVSQRWL